MLSSLGCAKTERIMFQRYKDPTSGLLLTAVDHADPRRSQRKSKCLQPILLEQTIDTAAAVMPISRNDSSVNAIASQHGPHNDGA
jgi:hypothetical protein